MLNFDLDIFWCQDDLRRQISIWGCQCAFEMGHFHTYSISRLCDGNIYNLKVPMSSRREKPWQNSQSTDENLLFATWHMVGKWAKCVLKSVIGRTIQPGGGQRGPGLQQLSLFLKALNYESEQRKPILTITQTILLELVILAIKLRAPTLQKLICVTLLTLQWIVASSHTKLPSLDCCCCQNHYRTTADRKPSTTQRHIPIAKQWPMTSLQAQNTLLPLPSLSIWYHASSFLSKKTGSL